MFQWIGIWEIYCNKRIFFLLRDLLLFMFCYDFREGEDFKGVEKNTDVFVVIEIIICNFVVVYVILNLKKRFKTFYYSEFEDFFCQILLKQEFQWFNVGGNKYQFLEGDFVCVIYIKLRICFWGEQCYLMWERFYGVCLILNLLDGGINVCNFNMFIGY